MRVQTRILCAGAMLVAALAMYASQKTGAAPDSSPAAEARPQVMDGSRGFVDKSGKLREPEIEERVQTTAAPAPAGKVTVILKSNGTRMVKLPPEFMSFSVAAVGSDGKVRVSEVTGDAEAAARIKEGVRPAPVSGKEAADVQ